MKWRVLAYTVLAIWIIIINGFSLYLSWPIATADVSETSIEMFDPEELMGIKVSDESWEIPKIREIAEEVADSHEYELHVYDCTEFSKELVRRLREEDIKARCSAGLLLDAEYTKHTWVSVFIGEKRLEVEATSGYIIHPEEYKMRYRKIWEGRCW